MSDVPLGNEGFISELDVRIFLRDTDPEANRLLDDLEFSPEEIRTAVTLAVDKWNETPPAINAYTVDTFPFRYHLILQTSANLLTIAAHRYRRNRLQLQITGGVADEQNKYDAYDVAADRLTQQFNEWMRLKKTEMNARMGWGWI